MTLVHDFIESEAALRALVGQPAERIRAKGRRALDEHCIAFIAHCPFVLVGSGDAAGNLDVSPRGDAPGFVAVLDERALALPERPGNRRADTLCNVLQRPKVALLFLVPGRGDTLRVSGSARIA